MALSFLALEIASPATNETSNRIKKMAVSHMTGAISPELRVFCDLSGTIGIDTGFTSDTWTLGEELGGGVTTLDAAAAGVGAGNSALAGSIVAEAARPSLMAV